MCVEVCGYFLYIYSVYVILSMSGHSLSVYLLTHHHKIKEIFTMHSLCCLGCEVLYSAHKAELQFAVSTKLCFQPLLRRNGLLSHMRMHVGHIYYNILLLLLCAA